MIKLKEKLIELHNKNYSLYKSIKNSYAFDGYTLRFDHIQGDPYATPSKIRIILTSTQHEIPNAIISDPIKSKAICDFINRKLYKLCRIHSRSISTGKSGLIEIAKPSQVILNRSSVNLTESRLEIRIGFGLPGNGRRIDGKSCINLLYNKIPDMIEQVIFKNLHLEKLEKHIETLEDSSEIRDQLEKNKLVAFIANGSKLARKSGNSDKPLLEAKTFMSCETYSIDIETPNSGVISGMGIKKGISLIVGGGFHGKSTLINAIADGIYDHIPGDGRELVVSLKNSFKIKAEEGRPVEGTNISPFINNLPNKKDTHKFFTENASGSTSQAANIIEALDSGSKLLIIDEDTSATNFLIRDYRMSLLTPEKSEPISPLINQISKMSDNLDVSFILVMGGNSQYFEVADHVIQMNEYTPIDVIKQVQSIIQNHPLDKIKHVDTNLIKEARKIDLSRINFTIRGRYKKKIESLKTLYIGENSIDISFLENFKENGQLLYISDILYNLSKTNREIDTQTIDKHLDSDRSIVNINTDRELSEIRAIDLLSIINRVRLKK